LEGKDLVLYTLEGERILPYSELREQLSEMREQLERERQRAERERQRAERLAQRLRALGIEPEEG